MIAPDHVLDTEATLPVYDAAWFIARLESVPDDQWCTTLYTDLKGRHCALGHLGKTMEVRTFLSDALRKLLPNIPGINDGYYGGGDTPKQRVLAALRALPTP